MERGMKLSRTIYWWYQGIGWAASAVFIVYLASKGRVSWWVPAVGVPIAVVLEYFRRRYYLPFVGGARRELMRDALISTFSAVISISFSGLMYFIWSGS